MTGTTPTEKNDEVRHVHSHELIDYTFLKEDEKAVRHFAERLSVSGSYSVPYFAKSIMQYGKHCTCDSGYLCEHRLQFIVDFVRVNFKKK